MFGDKLPFMLKKLVSIEEDADEFNSEEGNKFINP